MFAAGERYRKKIRSAEAMRSSLEIAEVRGMIVGAREARRWLKRVGVRPEREKGVVERGGSVATAVPGEVEAILGLGLRAAAAFSSPPADKERL